MKTRLLILFAVISSVFLVSSVPPGESMRMVWSLDKMIEMSDVFVTGTVKSTWVDIRLFEDRKVVDTATIAVDHWIKNKQDSDTLEIRYYGYWAQTIENLLGVHRGDTDVHSYESGQEVLLLATHEEPTMMMGEGYYPFFEGGYIITEDDAVSQSGEKTSLQQIYNTINSNLDSSREQRLDNILKICEKFGPQPNEKIIQSANDTHYINNQECQWHKSSNSSASLDRIVYPDPQFCADEFDKMYFKARAIPCSCCNPPPGEPVCEPVPIEGHIREMITEEFKPCISTIDRWAYLTENNDSAWYAFGTNYVKLKMEKTNLEKDIPISVTFSGYSQCLNDFHLVIKEHIMDGKVVFEENYNQVCDESKPNNEFKTYREITLEGIGNPISLQKGQYVIELYTETPQKHGSNYVDKVYFSSHFGTEPVIKLDAINQSDPSVWIVTGKTTDVKSEIIMHLYNPESVFVSRDIILPDSDGNFSTVITNDGTLFQLSGHYKITLQQGDATLPQVSRLFNVIQNEN